MGARVEAGDGQKYLFKKINLSPLPGGAVGGTLANGEALAWSLSGGISSSLSLSKLS